MRVLWFSNTPAAGDEYISSNGTGGWLKSLDKLIQDNVELHVAFFNRGYPKEFKVGNTTYHAVGPQTLKERITRRIQNFIGINTDLKKNLELINKVKPDIIHVHGAELRWIQIAKYTNVPVLLSIQTILTVMTHKFFSGISINDLPWNSKYRSDYKYYQRLVDNEREYVKYVKYVMGRTDWDRRVYSIIAPQARYFIGNEVLRDSFYTIRWTRHHRKDGKIIVHSTTGEALFKGLETICLALSELNRMGLDVEWRVAGVNAKHEFVDIIKNKLGENFPSKGLMLLGSVPEKALVDYMLEADVYVSASHQDNSPNALCEASIIGMPCVATFAGGTGTILQDKVTGLMVQDGDPWAMAGAILELVKHPDEADKYASNAREVALKRHDKTKILGEVLEAYHEIVG